MGIIKGLLLPALLALASSAAAKDEPLVAPTSFSNELVNLLYFDDSGVALVRELETGKVWRSHDAGKGWKELEDVYGNGIKMNPHDNQVALVWGEDKQFITFDQGETWKSFETEFPPTPMGPVSWHATDKKKILIHEMEDCFLAPCLGRVMLLQFPGCTTMTNLCLDLLYHRRIRIRPESPRRRPPHVSMGQGRGAFPRRRK
jgi:hypothetical protein